MNEFQVNTVLAVMADAYSTLQERFEERGKEIDRLHDKLWEVNDSTSFKVRDYDRMVEDRDYYMRALGKAQEDYQKVMAELRQYKASDPAVKSKADAFMETHPELHAADKKIACIKEVREITGWGLKETKDYVEAYVAARPRSLLG